MTNNRDVVTIDRKTGEVVTVPELGDPAAYAYALDQRIRSLAVDVRDQSLQLGLMIQEMRNGRRRDSETGEDRYLVEWAGYESYEAWLGDLGMARRWANRLIQAAQAAVIVQQRTGGPLRPEGLSLDKLTLLAPALEGSTDEERDRLIEQAEALSLSDLATSVAEFRASRLGPAPELPPGRFRCIVIDPPWPMPKIEREERPNQGATLDYPVISLDEIEVLLKDVIDQKAADGCHIYLWTTHHFLPSAQGIAERLGISYECLLTWVKPTGITPFSWQYNTEHAIFGRVGSLKLEQMGLKLSIEAPVTGHSEKPDAFYDRVRAASPGPRLELFARRERPGFEPWGNQVERLHEALR